MSWGALQMSNIAAALPRKSVNPFEDKSWLIEGEAKNKNADRLLSGLFGLSYSEPRSAG